MVHQYVADLRDLASRCPLPPGQEDFWVASILAIGCVSDKAWEWLFTLPEVDLVRVTEVLLSDEAVRTDLGAGQRMVVGTVGRGGFRGGSKSRQAGSQRGGAARSARTPASGSTSSCVNCGGPHSRGTNPALRKRRPATSARRRAT